MSIGPRNYVISCQLMVEQADNRASAQAAAEAAVGAITSSLAALAPSGVAAVSFSAEEEGGQYVFSES